MNNGYICVSVCADTADKFIDKIEKAAECTDVVELRFDCLNETDIDTALKQIEGTRPGKPLLATFRSPEQGGNRRLIVEKRKEFWENLPASFWAADLEEDISDIETVVENRIVSFHDFDGVPENLGDIYARLAAHSAIVKIAVKANDITDSLPLWKLLERARSQGRQLIPIAMGEAGKWTRILGLAHGSPLTYASLETGGETAPGQISGKDLAEVYRARTLDENTAVYGIIGGNTSYSMSPYIHNAAFNASNLNNVFVPLQTADLDEFIRRMVKPETREIELNFAGFSVTAPHKQAIIRHLDEIDESAKTIAAVNTVKIIDGKLNGFNTDAEGFIRPMKDAYSSLHDARVAVVGAGGAARACIYSLKKEGAEVTIFARDPEKAKNLAEEFDAKVEPLPKSQGTNPKTSFSRYDVLVNTTPLGTKGISENETVATADQLGGVTLVYDIVYNPQETRLLREAKTTGARTINGLEMLIGQAIKQFELWTGKEAPINEMRDAALRRL
ncbi:MAG TPA: shikimate dehydrogenase [Pyrinomonadaceae bacterium]|nr:shikimate dehydrogenase [Pyrinomonadaceae bacterium]